MHISRIAEELIIWNSDGFNLIKLSDKVVTGSSIMPQKKNPDHLEFLRGKSGQVYGNLFSMLTILKGLPLSYFKDLQDDKEIVFRTNDILINSLKILNEVLINFHPDHKKMLKLAKTGFITATDLADYLVEKDVPFRTAYQVVGEIVKYCLEGEKLFKNLKIDEFRKFHPKFDQDVFVNLEPLNVVKARTSEGGTGFTQVEIEVNNWKKKLLL
jgi:argininosuccinate lyase